MNLFWHKTATGRSIPGPIPVLFVGGAAMYVVIMLMNFGSNEPAKEREGPVSNVQIKDITDTVTAVNVASQEAAPVQAESISTRNDRNFTSYSDNLGYAPIIETEEVTQRNSISTIMQLVEGGGRGPEERRVIDDVPLVPTYLEEREILPIKGTVIKDDDEIQDVEIVGFSIAQEDPESQNNEPELTGFDTGEFLPRGYRIPVVLLGDFETGDLDPLVQFAVTEDVYFQNNVILKMGTRILADGSQTSVRERVTFSADMILYPDGRELPIDASVKSPDGASGLIGKYISPPVGVDIAGYSGPVIEALATIATQTEERTEVISGDSVSTTQTRDVADEFSTRNAIIGAASEIAQSRLEDSLTDYIQRNSPYVLVEAGERGYFVLRSAVDFKEAKLGGSYVALTNQPLPQQVTPTGIGLQPGYGQISVADGELRPRISPSSGIPVQRISDASRIPNFQEADQTRNTPLEIPGLR